MKTNAKRLLTMSVAALLLLLAGSAASNSGLAAAMGGSAGSRIQPGALLPGDHEPGPAALDQGMSDIAPGGGGYLVVWEDSRTNYLGVLPGQVCTGGPCGQTLKDIYAARLDANGQLIDTTPIVVSSARWDQTRPRVAWNGQNWLVVWTSQRVADFSSTTDVLAARVSPEGVVLDNPAIVVDGGSSVDELWPVVASDGTDWAVVWMDQGSYFELDAARIAPDGTLRDPGGVPLYTPSFPRAPYNATIAFAQDEYLLTWQEWRTSEDDIVGMRITPGLQRIDTSPFTISGALGYQTRPSVTSNGTDFFVSWTDERSLQVTQPFAARVTHGGQVLDPNGLELNYYFTSLINITDAAWDGSHWVVVWDDSDFGGNGLEVYAARVAPDGTVLDYDGFPVAVGPRNQSYPAAAQGTAGVQVTWTDDSIGGPAPGDVRAAGVTQEGTVGTPATVSWGAPSQRQPDFAPNLDSSVYLVVFMSEVSGQVRIKGQRLDANGTAIDQEPFLIAGGPSLRNPAVAWNGSVYLVVWEDPTIGPGAVPGTVFGRRVQADGTVLDPTPIQVMSGNTPDVAALGSDFLVVDTYEQINHTRLPRAVRVNSDGVVQGTAVVIGASYASVPHVAPLGNRWLATWQRNPTHDNPYSTIQATFVDANGVPASEFQVAPATSRRPNLATKVDQGLIAYNADGEVRARRILPDGTLLDPGGIQVTSAPMDQFSPALAWDGAEYVIAYEDYRAIPVAWDRPVSDVYATRVDANGMVLDPNGAAIANDPAPDVQPAVAALNGSFLIGYADFNEAAPFAAYRIDLLLGQAGGLPTPTFTPTGTPPTLTPAQTSTRTVTRTATSAATSSPTSTSVVTVTSTPVPGQIFSDVNPGDYFYEAVNWLATHGIVSGYSDGTFRPYNETTRGQLSKIVVLARGWPIATPTGTPTFQDVPPTNPFYGYIETAYSQGIISGYSCGTGCLEFRPFNNITRGQLTKVIVLAMSWALTPPTQPTFVDVAADHPFYAYIETAYAHQIISGYTCGTGCLEFRPGNNATRGQIAKIVYNAIQSPR